MLLGSAFQDTLEQFGPFYERPESEDLPNAPADNEPGRSHHEPPATAATTRMSPATNRADRPGATEPIHRNDGGATPRDFARATNRTRQTTSARDALRDAARQQTTDPKIPDLLDRLKDGEIKELIQQSLRELD